MQIMSKLLINWSFHAYLGYFENSALIIQFPVVLEDHTYATWTTQSDTSTPPISTRGTGRRWRMIAVHGIRPLKKELQKLKPKEQLMLKSNDNAAMNVRLQIEPISSQSSHADTAEKNSIDQLSHERACARKR